MKREFSLTGMWGLSKGRGAKRPFTLSRSRRGLCDNTVQGSSHMKRFLSVSYSDPVVECDRRYQARCVNLFAENTAIDVASVAAHLTPTSCKTKRINHLLLEAHNDSPLSPYRCVCLFTRTTKGVLRIWYVQVFTYARAGPTSYELSPT